MLQDCGAQDVVVRMLSASVRNRWAVFACLRRYIRLCSNDSLHRPVYASITPSLPARKNSRCSVLRPNLQGLARKSQVCVFRQLSLGYWLQEPEPPISLPVQVEDRTVKSQQLFSCTSCPKRLHNEVACQQTPPFKKR